MLSTFLVIAPVFALIFAGWLARRIDVLREHAAAELNRFVVYLALPAMLFVIIVHAQWDEIWQPDFVAAFGLSAVLAFGLTMAVQLRRHSLADAAIDGLNAGYANTGFIGFPLVLVVLGPTAMAPTMIATVITACLLFALAIVVIEIGLQSEASRGAIIAKVLGRLIRNPILVAPLLGAAWVSTGLPMPMPADIFLKMLAAAAPPCALVALGAFLAAKRKAAPGGTGETASLVAIKLIGQPAIAWLLATFVFRLSAPLTHVAVLLAALPTGTGPFMLAELYDRRAEVTARVILFSTIVSVVTVSAYLAMV